MYIDKVVMLLAKGRVLNMKKTIVCILTAAFLTGLCFSVYAETNMNYHISNVERLRGDEYSGNIKAEVYGFEEANNVSLRIGELKNPGAELIDKISGYKTANDKFFFAELTAFDTEQSSEITLTDKTDMQITFSKSSLGSGFAGCMGKDYKIFRMGNDVKELTIKSSTLYDVTFETDELGIFAVIYNPNAISLSFVSDDETEYQRLNDLAQNSTITFPENPQKSGFKFAGWYTRENGEGLRLYPGIKLNEVATDKVYARWVEDDAGYSASGTGLKNVIFGDGPECEINDNRHIYFIPEEKDLKEITATVEPENPYSYVYFGYSVDNIGEINSHSQTDLTYTINNSSATKESRMIVKIISEDLKNEAVYSFVFAEETPKTNIKSIDDDEHSGALQADISGADSFVISDEYDSPELKIGEITNPDADLKALANAVTAEGDTVIFFDLLACDNKAVINSDLTANFKVNLRIPTPEQPCERYEIYRADSNKLIPQSILSSDAEKVLFEADKPGSFVLVYGGNVYSVKFVSDGEEYKLYDKLKLGAVIPTPENPSKSGYTFIGWFTNENEKFENNTYVSGNAVYCAGWKKNASGGGLSVSYFTVKFDNDGAITSLSVAKNGKAAEPQAPEKAGYEFGGWYVDKEFTERFDFSTKITGNITLYAKWNAGDKTKNQIVFTVGKTEATVFGEEKQNDVAPLVLGDRFFLPVRFVAENLGAAIEWDEENQTVRIKKDDTEILITIGSEAAYVNGEPVLLEYPAFIENDRTYTPIGFVAEKLGGTVDRISADGMIVIMRS